MPDRTNRRDHPRIRGEHSSLLQSILVPWGSSPHTRGARAMPGAVRLPGGIIPAYAGSTDIPDRRRAARPDHPRIRGEHGAGQPRDPRGRWIIPAYAGSTTTGRACRLPAGDHPRIRGEHAVDHGGPAGVGGSSPHTRGARRTLAGVDYKYSIIPAYAGSTSTPPDGTVLDPGSSPHTRGAPP